MSSIQMLSEKKLDLISQLRIVHPESLGIVGLGLGSRRKHFRAKIMRKTQDDTLGVKGVNS